ncbi:FDX1 [Branchiostoma lanceolatum]|uniref:FDX1 protein n=1 Tax=Branchiostoma lanceolatum TaxID=7740 RepID=A0A8J9YP12_BRALA|nr:FDX1 [Branchiostoma lanceolatum]
MAASVLFPASVRLLSGFRHLSRVSRAAPISLCRPHNHSLSTTARHFSQPTPRAEKAKVTVHYSMADGQTVTVQSKEGENLLDIAIENDLDIDGFGINKVTVKFVMRDGSTVSVRSKVGENLLDIAIENDLDIDGFGACEGTLACSTCHLIFEQPIYDQLEEPTDEELDMLDLAFELTDTSRLGCQVCVTKALDGLTVKVPEGVADARDV